MVRIYAWAVIGYAIISFVISLISMAETILADLGLALVVLGPWLLREPIRREDLLFMGVMGLGLLPFFLGTDAASATAPAGPTGAAPARPRIP